MITFSFIWCQLTTEVVSWHSPSFAVFIYDIIYLESRKDRGSLFISEKSKGGFTGSMRQNRRGGVEGAQVCTHKKIWLEHHSSLTPGMRQWKIPSVQHSRMQSKWRRTIAALMV